jgi:hypothetical protein
MTITRAMTITWKKLNRRLCAVLAHAAAVCLLSAPAQAAAVDVDFNGDGIPDRIVLPRLPETNIVVRISGSRPLILKSPDHIVSIVATDVDHDGDVDLTALSERRGVLVWLNQGGRGRLKALTALTRTPHRRTFLLGDLRPRATRPRPSSDRPVTPNIQDYRDRFYRDVCTARVVAPHTSTRLSHFVSPALSSDSVGASSCRAPPSRASV